MRKRIVANLIPARARPLAAHLEEVAGIDVISIYAGVDAAGRRVFTINSEFDELDRDGGGTHLFVPYGSGVHQLHGPRELEIALTYAIAGAEWAARPDRAEEEAS